MSPTEFDELVETNLADYSNIIPEELREVFYALKNLFSKVLAINKGVINSIDVGSTTGSCSVSGDITSCTADSSISGNTKLTVVIPNEMPSSSYQVNIKLESPSGANLNNNSSVYAPVYEIINSTSFIISLKEPASITQDLKVHFETVPN